MKLNFFKLAIFASIVTAIVLLVVYEDSGHFFPNKSGNQNGDIYTIANPLPGNKYSTDFSTKEGAEYFEFYSPEIRTRYGEVFWKILDEVDLPEEIVTRYKNKDMSIIGWEIDQVYKGENGSKDESVLEFHAYNHHQFTWILSDQTELQERQVDKFDKKDLGMEHGHGASSLYEPQLKQPVSAIFKGSKQKNIESAAPLVQFIPEGGGGEMRNSFKGFPEGKVAMVHSPSKARVQVMQIDTMNRDHKGPGFKVGPLPKNTQAPENPSYSPLLECPCTDRITKEYETAYSSQTKGTCNKKVASTEECLKAAHYIGLFNLTSVKEVNNQNLPQGCLVQGTEVVFNSDQNTIDCSGGSIYSGSVEVVGNKFTMEYNSTNQTGVLTLEGPSDVWFGIGFGASAMAEKPYTVIVDGNGVVSERILADHAPGTLIPQSESKILAQVSNSISNKRRTVVLQFVLDKLYTTIPVISAYGNKAEFSYHAGRGAGSLVLVSKDSSTCLCNQGTTGFLHYRDENKDQKEVFKKNCLGEPISDMLKQHNPSCFIETYQGGIGCCKDGYRLIDTNQSAWDDDYVTYYMKYRIWFRDAKETDQNMIRSTWQTEHGNYEYDIPQCDAGTPPDQCIHSIQSHFTLRDMLHSCPLDKSPHCAGNLTGKTGFNMHYLAPHCHAPSCLSIELYNADTGKLICKADAKYGNSNKPFHEKDYLHLPPCLFGDDEGLEKTYFINFDTNLTSIKRNNNTNGHTGDMAYWLYRGVVV